MASAAFGRMASGRRWVESLIVSFVQWIVRLLSVACWALIVLLITGVLYWLAARMFGWPMQINVRVTPQELMGVGVFVFCAAYALRARG